MHEYHIHTLVDITNNGNLKQAFPFKSSSGDVIHDKNSLAIARNQNANFNTMLQLLQMRGNITWENDPVRVEMPTLGNHGFGSFYEGKNTMWNFQFFPYTPDCSVKNTMWNFQFFTEQSGVYGEITDPVEGLVGDFHLVPIVSFCKETVTFPYSTFDTLNHRTINTYFSYAGPIDK
jgi:hypothetical protein